MSPFQEGLPGQSDEVRSAFQRLLLSLADSKRILGIRYSDWLLGAPSIEAGIAASSMAQDEWGHARLLYATLKDFGQDPLVVEYERPPEAYASLGALDEPLDDWAAVVAAIVLADGALSVALEGLLEGGYATVEGRVGKMLAEEEFHRSLGDAWYRRLAKGSEEARGRLTEESERILPSALRCLAPGDGAHEALGRVGLTLPGAELRKRFAARVDPLLSLVELSASTGAPDLDGWDAGRGRGSGHPALEAVERARGDRNRALFVE
jgi:ring-1,2-phenylacetyl-CoA epoxidase subunit PaaC